MNHAAIADSQLFKAAIIIKSYGYTQTQETKHKGFFYEPFGPAATCREDQAASQEQCDQAEGPEGLLRPSRGARLLTEGRRELIRGMRGDMNPSRAISDERKQDMKTLPGLFITVALPFLLSCMSQERQAAAPLEVLPFVDLTRYTGRWYEISRYPNRFQEGCVGSRATYTLRSDGKMAVLNECYEGSFSGRLRDAKGTATVVDKKSNAKLRVSFFWPFYGDYWIIDLGKDYEYAVVGHPDRTYLWILSRTKKMDDTLYHEILSRIGAKGYDLTKLIKTQQE
jgi:apolipoprotein D and lipocalin family protein